MFLQLLNNFEFNRIDSRNRSYQILFYQKMSHCFKVIRVFVANRICYSLILIVNPTKHITNFNTFLRLNILIIIQRLGCCSSNKIFNYLMQLLRVQKRNENQKIKCRLDCLQGSFLLNFQAPIQVSQLNGVRRLNKRLKVFIRLSSGH